MATEILIATSVALTNLTGTIADIDDDPDSPDGNWIVVSGSNNAPIFSADFDTPTPNLDQGAGLQDFSILIRRNETGGNDIDFTINLYESDVLVSIIQTVTNFSDLTGTVFTPTWTASTLSATTGVNAQIRVLQTSGGTGNPGNRRFFEIGALEWNVSYTEVSATRRIFIIS